MPVPPAPPAPAPPPDMANTHGGGAGSGSGSGSGPVGGGGPGGGGGGGPGGGHRRQESMYALTGLYADTSNSSGSDGEREASGAASGRSDALASKALANKAFGHADSHAPFHKGHARNSSLGEH